MSDLIYLNTCEGNDARKLADAIDSGEVEHAVLCYCKANGDTCYHLIGRENLTYLIGMLQRVVVHLHCNDQYVIPEKT